MNRAVTYARFHTPLFVKDIGNIEAVMPPPNKTFTGFTMTARTAGIEVTMNGKNVLVPWPNVICAVLGKEIEDEKKAE